MPSRPPLTTRLGLVRAKSRSALATVTASPSTKAMAVGPDEQGHELVEAQVLGREAHQGVLVDLVVAAGGPQRAAQGGELPTRQAAVLGEDGGVGGVEPLLDLVDDGDLLGPRVLLHVSPRRAGHAGPFGAHSGAPDVYGTISCERTAYAAPATSSSVILVWLGSTRTPGPMVG